MINNSDLRAEIQNDPLGVGYSNMGARPILSALTLEDSASVENWIPSDTPKPVGKVTFLQQITSIEEGARMHDFTHTLPDDNAKAVAFKLYHTLTIDMSDVGNRYLVGQMTASDDLVTNSKPLKVATRDRILKLGEVKQSRSQELWSEEPTLEQIKEILNG